MVVQTLTKCHYNNCLLHYKMLRKPYKYFCFLQIEDFLVLVSFPYSLVCGNNIAYCIMERLYHFRPNDWWTGLKIFPNPNPNPNPNPTYVGILEH